MSNEVAEAPAFVAFSSPILTLKERGPHRSGVYACRELELGYAVCAEFVELYFGVKPARIIVDVSPVEFPGGGLPVEFSLGEFDTIEWRPCAGPEWPYPLDRTTYVNYQLMDRLPIPKNGKSLRVYINVREVKDDE